MRESVEAQYRWLRDRLGPATPFPALEELSERDCLILFGDPEGVEPVGVLTVEKLIQRGRIAWTPCS